MDHALPHRKRIRHYDIPGHVHALTFSCSQRRPILLQGEHCSLLARCVDRACNRHAYSLHAYVFMPEHVHLLVGASTASTTVSALLAAIRRPFAYEVRRGSLAEQPVWQKGPGFDRNLTSARLVRTQIAYIHANPVRRGLCDRPDEWAWSSWRHYDEPELVDADAPPGVTVFCS